MNIKKQGAYVLVAILLVNLLSFALGYVSGNIFWITILVCGAISWVGFKKK